MARSGPTLPKGLYWDPYNRTIVHENSNMYVVRTPDLVRCGKTLKYLIELFNHHASHLDWTVTAERLNDVLVRHPYYLAVRPVRLEVSKWKSKQ